jgi:hypothetical protein
MLDGRYALLTTGDSGANSVLPQYVTDILECTLLAHLGFDCPKTVIQFVVAQSPRTT